MKHLLCILIILSMLVTACIAQAEPQAVESALCVPYVAGSERDAFIRGADVSSLLSLLNSSVTFYDEVGEPMDGPGFFRLLACSGVNWVRLRVWNDPFDAEGHGYGGGNNDVQAALTMGRWATEAGMTVLVNFHYSDFWADPNKQQPPKAWAGFTVEEKAAALETYTYDCVKLLLDGGVDVGMVQIGNETNGRFCGETKWPELAQLINAGSRAIRALSAAYGRDIRVALHFTNPQKANWVSYVSDQLAKMKVDYDVYATSCYPYWHGSAENLTKVLRYPAEKHGKQVMVAETSWAYTLEDADGHSNTVGLGGNDKDPAYPFSVQGQAMEISALMQAVADVGESGIGLFYWEPAWIPVGLWREGDTAQWTENSRLWEQYGSGWATSYAGEYDPDDAGLWYGGSAVDNQALFDAQGHPLESLNVFRYVQTGTYGYEVIAVAAEDFEQEYGVGDALALPQTAHVLYNDGSEQDESIAWDAEQIAAVTMDVPGDYEVRGTAGGYPVKCRVMVRLVNLLSNPGFEDADMGMYSVSKTYVSRTNDDPHAGKYSLHFWSADLVDFTAAQTLSLSPGSYEFTLYAQGGDMGDTGVSHAFVRFAGTELTEPFVLTGWVKWASPVIRFELADAAEVELGVSVQAGKNGAWGTLDDWALYQLE